MAPNKAKACASRFSEHGRTVNVGDAERIASVVAGGGLLLGGIRRINSLKGALLAFVGGGLIYRGTAGHCSLYHALGVNTNRAPQTGVPARHGSRIEKSILINAPPEHVYRFWRQLENLPQFLNHIVSVEPAGGDRSHWVAEGPLGVRVAWDAEIINDKPGQMIAWRSLEGAQVDTAGAVRFAPGPNGRGTIVRVELKYDPPGGQAGIALAHLMGDAPDQHLASDLFRLKRVIEAGEISSTAVQPSGRQHEKTSRAAERVPAVNRYDQVEEASAESFPASDPPGWTATSATAKANKD